MKGQGQFRQKLRRPHLNLKAGTMMHAYHLCFSGDVNRRMEECNSTPGTGGEKKIRT
jgi:hypothetical protein